jgi:hypothetical protein
MSILNSGLLLVVSSVGSAKNTTFLKIVKHAVKFIWWRHRCRLGILHSKYESPGQNLVIIAMELFFANNFDSHSPGCFFDGVIVWFAVRWKAMKVMDSQCLFSDNPWDVTFSYPHFVSSVIDMIHSTCIVVRHFLRMMSNQFPPYTVNQPVYVAVIP